jgi:hypothetical protein
MAAERKTLVSPADLIAQYQAKTDKSDAGAVSPGPTEAPAAAPMSSTSQGKTAVPHLADKMKLLASSTKSFTAGLEKQIDDKIAAQQQAQSAVTAKVADAFAKTDAMIADAQAGAAELESELAQLSNE